MKAAYLLPCNCGNKVRVDAGQAGAKVPCSCGQQLLVPTFRALKELEAAPPAPALAATREDRPWSAGHGMLFSAGLLISVIAAVLICYHLFVFVQYRDGGETFKQDHLNQMRQGVEQMTAMETLMEFQQMSKAGLTVDGVPPWSQISAVRDNSFRWLMGALAALVVGLVFLAGSLLGSARRPRLP
jgi:hypothetical protein